MKQEMARKESKLMRYMKAPIGILIQAKDLYIESWSAGNVTYGNSMGCPTPHSPISPVNFSPRTYPSPPKHNLKKSLRSKPTSVCGGGKGLPPIVAPTDMMSMGRIDEDEPLEYGKEDVGLLRSEIVAKRSYEQNRFMRKL